ncbi:AMP-binding protein [Micromonospora palythoicola]|uniref:AMP-binding protein n=1 Tax=Micromonospora palythoicola TaxID=3120507 RepID=UPI002FCE4FF7
MTALSPATVLAGSADRHADTVAVVDGRVRVTYAELWLEARCYGAGLRAAGVRGGDAVALLAPNVVDFPRVYFGALVAGAVAVPVAVPVGPQAVQLAREARLLVCHTSHLAAGRRISVRAGVPLLTVGPGRGPSDVPRLEDLGDVPPGRTGGFADTDLDPAGRTEVDPDDTDVVLGCLPLGGRFGQTVTLTGTFRAGATLVLLGRFTGPAALDLMLREQVTVFHGTSAMYAALLDAARGRDSLPRLRRWVSRAPLPPSLRQRFTSTFDTVVHVAEGERDSSGRPDASTGRWRTARRLRSRRLGCHGERYRRGPGS